MGGGGGGGEGGEEGKDRKVVRIGLNEKRLVFRFKLASFLV